MGEARCCRRASVTSLPCAALLLVSSCQVPLIVQSDDLFCYMHKILFFLPTGRHVRSQISRSDFKVAPTVSDSAGSESTPPHLRRGLDIIKYYDIASLVVERGSFAEEYLKPHDEQFCFTKLCFYENSFSKCNHMPNWNEIQGRERA